MAPTAPQESVMAEAADGSECPFLFWLVADILYTASGLRSSRHRPASAQLRFELPVGDPGYWDRLRGWSDNPNQLAFLGVALGALCLHLAETSRGVQRVSAIACMPLPILVGCLTRSDAFAFVLVIGSL